MIVNVWSLPSATATAPEGAIDPPAPAEAVIVWLTGSPTAKSLNDVMPVACVLVAVRVPVAGADQFGASYFRTTKLLKSAPPSRSPAAKLNTASAVVNVVPEFVSVHWRLTLLLASMPEVAICAWSPPVVVAVSVPAPVTLEKVTLAGVYAVASPTSNVRATGPPMATDFCRLPST